MPTHSPRPATAQAPKAWDRDLRALYPKSRPDLPEAIAAIYAEHYKENRTGKTAASSLAQTMERWLHRQVARDVAKPQDPPQATLEIGAGTLNQLPFEPAAQPYDIVEPFAQLHQQSPALNRIRTIYADIAEIPDHQRYDRITSVATLEHLCNLPQVLAKSGTLLAGGGVFRAAVPSEGTFLWTLGWKLTTGLEFRLRHGLDYGLLMRHEHVNTAAEIETALRAFFGTVRCRVFGLSRALSLYRYYECREPRLERCREFLDRPPPSGRD